MPKLDYRNIERVPGRCGGQPVVGGTRIRAATILVCYRQGMRIEEIVQQLHPLKPADVHDALTYAHDHLDEIEADLAADDESKALGSPPVDREVSRPARAPERLSTSPRRLGPTPIVGDEGFEPPTPSV